MPPPTAIRTSRNGERHDANGQDVDMLDGLVEKDETERKLEKLLFGDEEGFLEALQTSRERTLVPLGDNDDDDENVVIGDEDLFFLDSGATDAPLAPSQPQDEEGFPTVAWVDSDDDRLTISLNANPRLRKLRELPSDDIVSGSEYIRRLRLQYERLHPHPEWANKRRKLSHSSDDSDDSDTSDVVAQPLSELLRSGGPLTRINTQGSKRKLRPEVIDIQRTHDVAKAGPSSVDVLEFHNELPLLLTAGPSSMITLYHVSPHPPNPNPILTSLYLKGSPVRSASFHDLQILVGARRRYFHRWALSSGLVTKMSRPVYGTTRQQQKTMENFKLSPDGKYVGLIGSTKKGGGVINVLSTESQQWVCQCRVESRGGVADFAWTKTGFLVIGKNGEVSDFDVESRSIVSRWQDEGSVGTTVIAIGGDRWIAVGSSSGMVNLYDRLNGKDGQPRRVFDQLTTPVSHLVFSDDGQMLVIASRWQKNALRLVHLPSCSVYRNWPTDKTPLGRISSVALSKGGDLLAVGNEQGKVRLWEIRD